MSKPPINEFPGNTPGAKQRFRFRGVLLWLVIFTLTGPHLAAESGGVLVSASIGESSNLVPILAGDSASASVVGNVFNGLLRYNPGLELEGDLAASWDVLDEGKQIVFHLRKGVLWHDRAPFTAKDVEFTYRKLVDKNVPTPYSGDFEKIASFEVLDEHTVRVIYNEPFSPALASWTMSIMPEHLLKNEDLTKTFFSRNPIGTGPYRFKRWADGDFIELAAFDRYFRGRPKIDRLIMRVIPDQTTMFLELHQETVDEMSLTPVQYARLTESGYFKATFRKFRYPSFGYTYLGYNLQNPLFQDAAVRRALGLAVDKNEIIQGVLSGLGRVCTGPFTPESWAYNPDVQTRAADPDLARRILQESGWRDTDGDGILDKDGKPFQFTILTNQGNFQRKLTAEIIQRRLKEIGVDVRIKVIEWSAFINEFIGKRKFEAVLLGWSLSREPDPFDIWHSSKTGPGEFNFISYKNAEMDRLIEEGRATFDRARRKEIYHRIHAILNDEEPVMFLYIPDALPIIHRRFKNVRVTALGLGYNFIEWEVPFEERKYTRYQL